MISNIYKEMNRKFYKLQNNQLPVKMGGVWMFGKIKSRVKEFTINREDL